MYLVCFISFDSLFSAILPWPTWITLFKLSNAEWVWLLRNHLFCFLYLYQIRGFSRLLTWNTFIISDTCSYCGGIDYHLRCPHSLVVALHTNDHTSRLCFGEAVLCLVAQGHLEPLIQQSMYIGSTFFLISFFHSPVKNLCI